MTIHWTRIAQLTAIGACCSLAVWISATSAKDEGGSVLVKKPAAAATQGPALPPPANPQKDLANPQKDVVQPAPSQPAKPAAKRPFMQPAQPRESVSGKLTADGEALPPPADARTAPSTKELNVRPAPPIVYDTDRDARRLYRAGKVDLVMLTQNPSDGCYYEIPMCVPACCTGEPTVSGGHGIFGRGVVEYCWSCGFRAKVKFRHVLGNVKVEYEGD